jgi:hypothetical protein
MASAAEARRGAASAAPASPAAVRAAVGRFAEVALRRGLRPLQHSLSGATSTPGSAPGGATPGAG